MEFLTRFRFEARPIIDHGDGHWKWRAGRLKVVLTARKKSQAMQFPVQAIYVSLLRYIIMSEHVVRSHLSLYFAASIETLRFRSMALLSFAVRSFESSLFGWYHFYPLVWCILVGQRILFPSPDLI
jgi:hypothetical protein